MSRVSFEIICAIWLMSKCCFDNVQVRHGAKLSFEMKNCFEKEVIRLLMPNFALILSVINDLCLKLYVQSNSTRTGCKFYCWKTDTLKWEGGQIKIAIYTLKV